MSDGDLTRADWNRDRRHRCRPHTLAFDQDLRAGRGVDDEQAHGEFNRVRGHLTWTNVDLCVRLEMEVRVHERDLVLTRRELDALVSADAKLARAVEDVDRNPREHRQES